MNDRERLIDLIKKAEKQELLDLFTADLDEAIDMSVGTQFNGTVEYLADYLISNGVIVPLWKVGDIVYVCYEESPIIHKKQICLIICQHSYGKSQLEFHCTDFYIFYGEEIGKTVFLTREEAEKALLERKSYEV